MPNPPFKVTSPVKLADIDPSFCNGQSQEETEPKTQEYCQKIGELQRKLFAHSHRGILVVLQGLDAAGKDGATRRLLSHIDPTGMSLTSFKAPTRTEKEHDFLWRVHQAMPPYGAFGVWNRSHYEDILVPRVLKWVPAKVWKRRHDHINAFEQYLTENNYIILKFYLHISKDEQAKRLKQRLNEPHKQWKFEAADLEMREHWDDFIQAYEEIFERCSPKHAPWYIIPANRKWYRNYLMSKIVYETLESLNLSWPEPSVDLGQYFVK